jgi:hypothetical protein
MVINNLFPMHRCFASGNKICVSIFLLSFGCSFLNVTSPPHITMLCLWEIDIRFMNSLQENVDPLLRNDREIRDYTTDVANNATANNGCC